MVNCSILFLTIRHAHKITKKLAEKEGPVKEKLRLNRVVTFLHIIIILACTISAFLLFLNYNISTLYSINLTIALEIFTALQDIFLSFNFFFILDGT
jgi:hypothetical protein